MKIIFKRTKKGASIVFKAENGTDAVNLKNAVMAAASEGFEAAAIARELHQQGYGQEVIVDKTGMVSK